jgi:hypothetical protein
MITMMIIIIIQFFIHLRAEINSQWPTTESARIQTTAMTTQDKTRTKGTTKRKMNQFRLLTLEQQFLKYM